MSVSVSPVAMSVGLVTSGKCWLLAYNVWLGVLTYSIFDSPMWKWFLHCGKHLPCPLSKWCVPCGFCTCWHVSLSPKLEYLGDNADDTVAQGPGCALVTPRCILVGSCLCLHRVGVYTVGSLYPWVPNPWIQPTMD